MEEVLVLEIRAAFPSDLENDLILSIFRHFDLLTCAEMHEMQEANLGSTLVVTSTHADFAGYSK